MIISFGGWMESSCGLTTKNSVIYSMNIWRMSDDLSFLKMVYFASVQSLLSYGVVCWGNGSYSNSLFWAELALRTIVSMKYWYTCRGVIRINNISLCQVNIFTIASNISCNIQSYLRNSEIIVRWSDRLIDHII